MRAFRKTVFLDRDGVINRYPGHNEYVKSWREFAFLPGVKPALKKLSQRGFELFIVSNQAGVAKGLYGKQALELTTKNMLSELADCGVSISGVYYCTHVQEEDCPCRKPKTGLIDSAIKELKKRGREIDRENSYIVGDSLRDIETGKRAGLKTILVFSGKETPESRQGWSCAPDFTARDLAEAAEIILAA